jgi:1-acyl-sn-glycerol-3-phosphate acyltransferase
VTEAGLQWLRRGDGPLTRTALDGASMSDVTRLVAEIRGENPPNGPFDAARREPSLEDERPAS